MDIVEIGNRIKSTRVSKKMSQRDLVAATGLTLPSVQSVEGGKQNYTIGSLIKILQALDLAITI